MNQTNHGTAATSTSQPARLAVRTVAVGCGNHDVEEQTFRHGIARYREMDFL